MNKKFLDEFLETVVSIKDKDDLFSFIKGILTKKELLEISTRLQIIKMLKAGIPQHKIAEELHVGVATVTRGSKELHRGRFKTIEPYGK